MSIRTKQFIQAILASSASVVGLCAAHGQITASWLNPVSGTWTDPTKWSTGPLYYPDDGVPPGATYNVTIAGDDTPFTVHILGPNIGIVALNFPANRATLRLGEGNSFTSVSDVYMNGGSILFDAPSSSTWAEFDLGGPLGGGFKGTGSVVFGSGRGNRVCLVNAADISAGITVTTSGADGQVVDFSSPSSGRTSRNFGSILSQQPGLLMDVLSALNMFENRGSILASNGGNLKLTNISNFGTISISGGGTLTIDGSFANAGTCSAANSTVVVSGTISSSVASSITRSNSPLVLRNWYDNTGTTLLLSAAKGDFWLDVSGRIRGGTISSTDGTPLRVTPPPWRDDRPRVLDGVTLETDVVGAAATGVDVYNGLTLHGATIDVNGVTFRGTQSLDGMGTIATNGIGDNYLSVWNGTLTIHSGIHVSKPLGYDANTAGIINKGTITAKSVFITANENIMRTAPGGTMSAALWQSNSGTISTDSGFLSVGGNFANTGTIVATNNANLTMTGTWSNAGLIATENSNLVLGGNFSTPDMGVITRTGTGTTLLTGWMTNAGNVLTLDRPWVIDDQGRILGGTVNGINGATLDLRRDSSLNGVVLNVPLKVSSVVHNAEEVYLVNVTNQSTITIPTCRITSNGLNNLGTVLISGGSLVCQSGLQNAGTIELNTGTLSLTAPWTSTGAININGGTVILGGAWNASLFNTLHRNAGTIVMGGTLSNAGSTFAVDPISKWVLSMGTVEGGTLESVNGGTLAATNYSVLNNVILQAPLTVQTTANSSTLNISNGITLRKGVPLCLGNGSWGANANLNFAGATQSISGNGEIIFDTARRPMPPFYPALPLCSITAASGTIEIGDEITVRTGFGGGTIGTSTTTLLNRGVISAGTPGQSIWFLGSVINLGLIEAANGGTIILPSTTANYSGGTLTGGTWRAAGASTMSLASASITTNAATVILEGLTSSFAPINSLRTNLGRFTITNDRDFTSTDTLTNSGTMVIGPNSVLRTTGDLFNSGSIDLAGGVVLVDYPVGAPGNANLLLNQIGTQIYTSSALANPALRIGYADNSELGAGTFSGQVIDGSTMILMMTFAGDSNLDGTVNTIDFNRLAGNFGAANTNWLGSDFNYDHTVDSVDFTLFLTGYGQKLPAPSPELGAIVPEPGAVALFTLWLLRAAALCRRPARRRATNHH